MTTDTAHLIESLRSVIAPGSTHLDVRLSRGDIVMLLGHVDALRAVARTWSAAASQEGSEAQACEAAGLSGSAAAGGRASGLQDGAVIDTAGDGAVEGAVNALDDHVVMGRVKHQVLLAGESGSAILLPVDADMRPSETTPARQPLRDLGSPLGKRILELAERIARAIERAHGIGSAK